MNDKTMQNDQTTNQPNPTSMSPEDSSATQVGQEQTSEEIVNDTAMAQAISEAEPEIEEPEESTEVPHGTEEENLEADTEAEPQEIVLTKADDSLLTDADNEEVKAFAVENNLNSEQAQGLLAQRESFFKEGQNRLMKNIEAQSEAQKKELLAMEAFSTDEAKAESFLGIKKVVDQFGDDEFKALMNTGFGNSPAVARLLLNISKAMGSDTIEGKAATPKPKEKTVHEKMYPHFFENS